MKENNILKAKIDLLQEEVKKLSESNLGDKELLEAQLEIISEFEKVIVDEIAIKTYDFSKAIELANEYDYKPENLAKIIADIQNVFAIRDELNLTRDEMPLESIQVATFREFVSSIMNIKKGIISKLEELEKNSSLDLEKRIDNLEALKNIFEGSGTRKYYTEDMFKTLWEELDVLNLSSKDSKELLDEFYETRNINTTHNKEAVPFEDIVALYKEYISEDKWSRFERLLIKYKDEITKGIDLENTEEILEFLVEKDILNKFDLTALLQVSAYGNANYIKETIYDKIMKYDSDNRNAFFKESLASVWVKVPGTNTRSSKPFRTTRENSGNSSKDNEGLYSACHTIDYDEFLQNIQLLKDNSHLFGDSFENTDIGANLRLTSQSNKILKRDIELCKMLGLGEIYPIPVSTFMNGGIEDKIHLAIELGLLKSPMTEYFQEMDKDINKNYEFKRANNKNGLSNQTIRNYFERYMSKMGVTTINDFAYKFYRLQRQNYISFYNSFFSSSKAGTAGKDFVNTLDRDLFTDKDKMDMFISSNFMNDWYPEYINGYDEYESVISASDNDGEYIDPSVLDEPLIKDLEENNTIYDLLTQGDDLVQIKNEYVYMFGDRIISRYKVLHNASILKEEYGTLTEDMLMTAIVRNSFLDEKTYKRIENCVWKRGMVM